MRHQSAGVNHSGNGRTYFYFIGEYSRLSLSPTSRIVGLAMDYPLLLEIFVNNIRTVLHQLCPALPVSCDNVINLIRDKVKAGLSGRTDQRARAKYTHMPDFEHSRPPIHLALALGLASPRWPC